MISVYKIKPYFQKTLMPILNALHRKNITANQITVFAILFSIVLAILFWFADLYHFFFLLLPIGLLIRMALNALDGMMARLYKQTSKKGELLNEVGDIFSDFILFIPLLKFQSESLYLIVLFIGLSIINEFAGLMGKVLDGERRYDGPMGKSDRALVLGVYGLLMFLHINMSGVSLYLFIIVNLLLLLSTITRCRKALKNAQ
ncbi:CDP-alcohol phosphatidyltransferase family protein [Myroides sp. M-43]|uniref:CDP-alcohol phosphatidyltransferase family protein n=1 Tax=Myroides oncorhynchi TaxID=2893756 RepID=UPI001E5D3A81|nr:CDP-alcohol phosphatidyltransferase family protein [Myroides oncorhynchi]MCC9044386.1 CDP-alcohol phosphatidyltransferase family protein [Myroides oncorhynchi]